MKWALSSIMDHLHDALPYCWTRVHRTKRPWTDISEYLGQNNFSLHYLPRHLVTVLEWELIPFYLTAQHVPPSHSLLSTYISRFIFQLDSTPAPPLRNNSLNFYYLTLLAEVAIRIFIMRDKKLMSSLAWKAYKGGSPCVSRHIFSLGKQFHGWLQSFSIRGM